MSLPPLVTAMPLLENVFMGTLQILSPLKYSQLALITNPWVYPVVDTVIFEKSKARTGGTVAESLETGVVRVLIGGSLGAWPRL